MQSHALPAPGAYAGAEIECLPFTSPTSRWRVPPARSYEQAISDGITWARHMACFLRDNPELAEGPVLACVLRDLTPSLTDTRDEKGYAVGFLQEIQRSLVC